MNELRRYFIIAVTAFFFISRGAYGMNPFIKDSVPVGSVWDKELRQRYGNGDTANSLIHFYEVKRRSTRITTALLFAATAAAGLAYDKASRDPDPNDPIREGAGFQSLFPFLVLLLLIPVSVISFINMFRFNRKQQEKRLASYAAGKPVSKWIKESRGFKNVFRKQ